MPKFVQVEQSDRLWNMGRAAIAVIIKFNCMEVLCEWHKFVVFEFHVSHMFSVYNEVPDLVLFGLL